MFSLFKKKKAADVDIGTLRIEMHRQHAESCEAIKEKWLGFQKTMHFKPGVSLAQQIELFSQPLSQFYGTKYPLLVKADLFSIALHSGIAEARTHSIDALDAAMAELKKRLGWK